MLDHIDAGTIAGGTIAVAAYFADINDIVIFAVGVLTAILLIMRICKRFRGHNGERDKHNNTNGGDK